VVQREQPDTEIEDIAKALIASAGAARQLLENELVRLINKKKT
jgi:hypothetical protein